MHRARSTRMSANLFRGDASFVLLCSIFGGFVEEYTAARIRKDILLVGVMVDCCWTRRDAGAFGEVQFGLIEDLGGTRHSPINFVVAFNLSILSTTPVSFLGCRGSFYFACSLSHLPCSLLLLSMLLLSFFGRLASCFHRCTRWLAAAEEVPPAQKIIRNHHHHHVRVFIAH